jgi:hypothetical protein
MLSRFKLAYYSRTLLIQIKYNGEPCDMQKIQIIGFFFDNRLHWQFEEEKNVNKWLF